MDNLTEREQKLLKQQQDIAGQGIDQETVGASTGAPQSQTRAGGFYGEEWSPGKQPAQDEVADEGTST